MTNFLRVLGLALVFTVLLLALAQEQQQGQATVQVAQSEQYGEYLTDAQGRTVYLFEKEEGKEQEGEQEQPEGVNEMAAPCTGECLEAWPPLLTEGEPIAGEGVDASLLGTVTLEDGSTQVTYNGWPLYYFVKDENPGDISGQDIHSFGGEWYIVSPEGNPVEEEGEEGGMTGGEGQTGGEGATGGEDQTDGGY